MVLTCYYWVQFHWNSNILFIFYLFLNKYIVVYFFFNFVRYHRCFHLILKLTLQFFELFDSIYRDDEMESHATMSISLTNESLSGDANIESTCARCGDANKLCVDVNIGSPIHELMSIWWWWLLLFWLWWWWWDDDNSGSQCCIDISVFPLLRLQLLLSIPSTNTAMMFIAMQWWWGTWWAWRIQ